MIVIRHLQSKLTIFLLMTQTLTACSNFSLRNPGSSVKESATLQTNACALASGILGALPGPITQGLGGLVGTIASAAASLINPNCKNGAALSELGQQSLDDIAAIMTDVISGTVMEQYKTDLNALGSSLQNYHPYTAGSANADSTTAALNTLTNQSESVYAKFYQPINNPDDPSYVKNYMMAAALRVIIYQEALRFAIEKSVKGNSMTADRSTLATNAKQISGFIDNANDHINKLKNDSVPKIVRTWYSSDNSVKQDVTAVLWDPGDRDFVEGSKPDLNNTKSVDYGLCYTSTADPATIAAATSRSAPTLQKLRQKFSNTPTCVNFTIDADGTSVSNTDVKGVSDSAKAREKGLNDTLLPQVLGMYNDAILGDLFDDNDMKSFNQNMTSVKTAVDALAQALPNCTDGNCRFGGN